MNLAQIRNKLVDLSGRFDLVTVVGETTEDNGADFFIQAGQRFLDQRFATSFDHSTVDVPIVSGQEVYAIGAFRSIEGISYVNDAGVATGLCEYSVADFFMQPSVPTGTPLYYATGRYQSERTVAAYGAQAFYIWPVPESDAGVLRIHGLVFSGSLIEDEDISFWSVAHPELLVLAAQYKMETHQRSRTGMRDFLTAIEEAAQGIVFDSYEQSVAQPIQLRNTW